MLLILLTSLSPNCHRIPKEKINPLLYFFAELHSLYSMFQSTTKILSLHDNVLKCTSSTQICSQPNCNIGHHCLQCKQFTVYLRSTDTLTFRKINWHNMSFHTHHIVQCIAITSKGR